MIEKWDNIFSENYLDKQSPADELKSDTISFQKIIYANNLIQMSWNVTQTISTIIGKPLLLKVSRQNRIKDKKKQIDGL